MERQRCRRRAGGGTSRIVPFLRMKGVCADGGFVGLVAGGILWRDSVVCSEVGSCMAGWRDKGGRFERPLYLYVTSYTTHPIAGKNYSTT